MAGLIADRKFNNFEFTPTRTGIVMAKTYYRCKACRKRKVLPKPIEEYRYFVRSLSCYGCWGVEFYEDKHRKKQKTEHVAGYEVCNCDGVHYPHRPGSVKLCDKR